jgi:hypothetical protein
MMHPGDVEQKVLCPPGLRILKAFFHQDAPLLQRIAEPIGRERGNIKEITGGGAHPANSRGCHTARIMYNQQSRGRGSGPAARAMHAEAR